MGIVRLAKCLRALNSITEYTSRKSDISNKISGNRVYMDFISIVYKIQDTVINEINYLLFTFILMKDRLLDNNELKSDKLKDIINKYKSIIPRYPELEKHINNSQEITIDDVYIQKFIDSVKYIGNLNEYIYISVVGFIIDMLANKLSDVEYILIAFDGIPSYGKIQEQRQRRYMRQALIEFHTMIKNEYYSDSPIMKARKEYDSKLIVPDIKSATEYVYNKYHSRDLQRDISNAFTGVIVDVSDKPYGEGEKVLMDILAIDYSVYKDNKSYVFYSPDGDSVILCLYLYVKYKIKNLHVIKTYLLQPSDRANQQTQYVDIPVLYNNIVNIVKKMSKMTDNIDSVVSDSICYDFILLINLYGNDFIHAIPTFDISTTIMDLLYVYSDHIKNNEFILSVNYKTIPSRVSINYNSLRLFIRSLATFEEFFMLDTYLADTNDKNRIIKTFGNVFPCRYALDYKQKVTDYKNALYKRITENNEQEDNIKSMVLEIVGLLNQYSTYTQKKYGDIFLEIEVKNIGSYVSKIKKDTSFLLMKFPKFLYGIKPKKNKTENFLIKMVTNMEMDLINNATPINIDSIMRSKDSVVRDFSFDYHNIRLFIPHNQMPTTMKDIDMYLLEWKGGKWMNILGSQPFELGYDWKQDKIKNIKKEMKRYQHGVIDYSDTKMERLVIDYLKTLSWMVDYYMNTNDTNNYISTWAFLHKRSPFITHVSNFLDSLSDSDEIVNKKMKNMMRNVYSKSLVPTNNYLSRDMHKFYIYPQKSSVIKNIPDRYKIYFPDINEFVKRQMNNSEEKLFDCKMCPYFGKCHMKDKNMTFNELANFRIPIPNIPMIHTGGYIYYYSVPYYY